MPATDGPMYARDLVKQIKTRQAGLCFGVGGYPETHPEVGIRWTANQIEELVSRDVPGIPVFTS